MLASWRVQPDIQRSERILSHISAPPSRLRLLKTEKSCVWLGHHSVTASIGNLGQWFGLDVVSLGIQEHFTISLARAFPKSVGHLCRINPKSLPPVGFVTRAVELAVVRTAERDREFVADLPSERTGGAA